MQSMYLLIPLSLMLFVVGIWAVRFAVKSNQFEDLDNAAQRVILDDRQERRQTLTDIKDKPLDSDSINHRTSSKTTANNKSDRPSA